MAFQKTITRISSSNSSISPSYYISSTLKKFSILQSTSVTRQMSSSSSSTFPNVPSNSTSCPSFPSFTTTSNCTASSLPSNNLNISENRSTSSLQVYFIFFFSVVLVSLIVFFLFFCFNWIHYLQYFFHLWGFIHFYKLQNSFIFIMGVSIVKNINFESYWIIRSRSSYFYIMDCGRWSVGNY